MIFLGLFGSKEGRLTYISRLLVERLIVLVQHNLRRGLGTYFNANPRYPISAKRNSLSGDLFRTSPSLLNKIKIWVAQQSY